MSCNGCTYWWGTSCWCDCWAHQIHTTNTHSNLHISLPCSRTGLWGYVHLGECCCVLPDPNLPWVAGTATVLFEDFPGACGKGGSSTLIRCYRCGRAMGITACGRDNTTAKLASINCNLGTTLLAPATSLSKGAAVKAPKSSSPRIALVKAECIYLRNYLMHVFMHEILL
jgi:hypothetical protein